MSDKKQKPVIVINFKTYKSGKDVLKMEIFTRKTTKLNIASVVN